MSVHAAEETAEGLRLAAATVAADSGDPTALRIGGFSRIILAREYEAALVLIDKSLALDPNSAMSWGFRGWTKIWTEQVDESKDGVSRRLCLMTSG